MKNGKSNFGFSCIYNMANFEAFRWNFSSSISLFFPKSGQLVSGYLLIFFGICGHRIRSPRRKLFLCKFNYKLSILDSALNFFFYLKQKRRTSKNSQRRPSWTENGKKFTHLLYRLLVVYAHKEIGLAFFSFLKFD